MGQLHGRVDVEVLARLLMDAVDHGGDLGPELRGLCGKDRRIGRKTRALHLQEHRQKRHLELGEEPVRSVRGHQFDKVRQEQADTHGIKRGLGQPVGGLGQGHLG